MQEETVCVIKDCSQNIFKAMLEFFYLGETKINSNDLLDLLMISEKYLLPGIKMAIEQQFINNLNQDNF